MKFRAMAFSTLLSICGVLAAPTCATGKDPGEKLERELPVSRVFAASQIDELKPSNQLRYAVGRNVDIQKVLNKLMSRILKEKTSDSAPAVGLERTDLWVLGNGKTGVLVEVIVGGDLMQLFWAKRVSDHEYITDWRKNNPMIGTYKADSYMSLFPHEHVHFSR